MSSLIAIGFSQAEDPQEAAYQASMMVKNQFKTTAVDMLLLFTSIHYAKKEVLEVIHSILKPTRLVGSSSAGLILSQALYNRGITIVAIHSPTINFSVGSSSFTTKEALRQSGFELGRNLILDYKSSFVRQAAFTFYDGLLDYNNEFTLGTQEPLGHSCPLIGAFSCDDFKFKKTYQFYQKQILSNSAAGFLMGSSDSSLVFSNKHGFKPLGKPRTITSSEGPIIHTIDHKPAVAIYEEFLKGEAENLKRGFLNSPGSLYPLGVFLEEQGQYLLRYPVDILSDGSIVCQTDVPLNAEVHLTINNKDSCRQSSLAAAQEIKDALGGQPAKLVIVFESMLRHKILGRHLFLEIQAIKEVLGPTTPLVGMYSFGELCHLELNKDTISTYLQNASLLLLAIG